MVIFDGERQTEYGEERETYANHVARTGYWVGWVEICAPAELYEVAVEGYCFTCAAEIYLYWETSH